MKRLVSFWQSDTFSERKDKMRKAINLLVVFAMVMTGCTTAGKSQQVVRRIEKEGGGVIEHPSGLTVFIPPGGLYENAELMVEVVEPPHDADAQTYVLPEPVAYAIGLSGEEAFQRPVEVAIPYDPTLLPEGRSEAEIFPVYFYDGVWYRVEGEVDEEENIVKAILLHNGILSWAYDTVENVVSGVVSLFLKESERPETKEQAYSLLELREVELNVIKREARFRVDNTVSLEEVRKSVEFAIARLGAAKILEILASSPLAATGGKAGIVYVAGVPVGAIFTKVAFGLKVIGIGTGVAFAITLTVDNVDVWIQVLRIEAAYQRYVEAEAFVFALEHPGLNSMPPIYAEALNNYYAALQISQTVSSASDLELDLTVSAYEDPSQPEIQIPPEYAREITDFTEALEQAIRAAGSRDAREWFPLIDPSLNEEKRKQIARLLYLELKPYTLSCLSYQTGATGVFTNGALLTFRATSLDGSGDKIFRFTIGTPPDSTVFRYASYFETWQDWDEDYWESVKGQGIACPGTEVEKDVEAEGGEKDAQYPIVGQVAFTEKGNLERSPIFLLDLPTGETRILLDEGWLPESTFVEDMVWSLDGSRLYVFTNVPNAERQKGPIYVIDPAEPELVKVAETPTDIPVFQEISEYDISVFGDTFTGTLDGYPLWLFSHGYYSQSGEYLVFAMNHEQWTTSEAYVVKVGDTSPRSLGGWIADLNSGWSSDSLWFAFTRTDFSGDDVGCAIYITSVNGDEPILVYMAGGFYEMIAAWRSW